MEITIELSDELITKKHLRVYREHDGSVMELPRDAGDEYFRTDGKYLIISARKYSVYALGYDIEQPEKPEQPVKPEQPDNKPDPDKNNPIEGTGNGDGNNNSGSHGGNNAKPSSINTGDISNMARSQFTMIASFSVMATAYYKMKRNYVNEHGKDCFYGIRNKLRFTCFLVKRAVHDIKSYIISEKRTVFHS